LLPAHSICKSSILHGNVSARRTQTEDTDIVSVYGTYVCWSFHRRQVSREKWVLGFGNNSDLRAAATKP
jgi:hypothetical protein